MFADNLLIGTGWGIFQLSSINTRTRLKYTTLAFQFNGKDPHGDLMGIAGELGIIGLLLFIVLFTKVLVRNITTFWKNNSMEKRTWESLLSHC